MKHRLGYMHCTHFPLMEKETKCNFVLDFYYFYDLNDTY